MVEAMADRFDWRADWRCLPGLLVIDPDAPGPKHGDADGVLAWDELTKTRPVPGMTEIEAKTFGVSEEERRFLFRVDGAKVNIAKPSATAQWFKLVSVNLENGSDTYPNGDDVQTVERWTPPGQFEGVSTADLNKALEKLGAGMGDGRLYSVAPSAKARAAWRVVQEVCPTQNEQQCRGIIATWVKNGVLTLGPYHDEKERRDVEGITGAKTVGVDIET
jgi:hypothetical protein